MCTSERRPQEFFISHWWTPSTPWALQEPNANFVTKHLLPVHSVSCSNSDFATSERVFFFQLSQSHFTEEGAHGKTEVLRESISELSECIHSSWRFFKRMGKKKKTNNFLKEIKKRIFLMLRINENRTNRISQNVAKKKIKRKTKPRPFLWRKGNRIQIKYCRKC